MSYDVVALWLGRGLVHYKLSAKQMGDYVAAIHRSHASDLTAAEEMGPDLEHAVCGGARSALLRAAPGGLSDEDAMRVVRAMFAEHARAIDRSELWARASRSADVEAVFRGHNRLMLDF
jgi:hypothetical protein